MLERPPERHAFEEAEEQRRTHRQKRAADVADQKNEESDMHRRNAASVHRDPGPDKEHRGADCSDQIGQDCPGEKKKRVSSRTAWSFNAKMNSARYDEE